MRHPFLSHHPDAPGLIAQAFWVLVLGTLGLIVMGVLVAGTQVLESTILVIVALVLGVLWSVHAVEVRAHRSEIQHDPAFHHARERRGF